MKSTVNNKVKGFISLVTAILSLILLCLSVYSLLLNVDYSSATESVQKGSIIAIGMLELARVFGSFACSSLGAVFGFIGYSISKSMKIKRLLLVTLALNLLLFLITVIFVII